VRAWVVCYQRIGEILRELPKAKAGRKPNDSDTSEELTKAEAIKESGIPKSQAYDLQALAANPDVVQAVLDKAEQDGTPTKAEAMRGLARPSSRTPVDADTQWR